MDVILDLREKYSKVRKLLEEDFKKDPEEEPYRSKYKAKAILLEMKDIIVNKIDGMSNDNEQILPFKAMLPVIIYQVGLICVDTEEPAEGERQFKDCFDLIVDHLDPRFVLVSIHVRNQLGILWSQRSQPNEARSWLEGSETTYKDFKHLGKVPKHFHEHFEEESSDGDKELEMVHTLTKFYLAQVYGVLKDLLKSAVYCHETLRRQLVYNEYDSIDWALNSATLSQFFMERILFRQARHHLAAASYVLDIYEDSLKGMAGTQEEIDAKKEELRHRSSDVSRCWAKYGIFLLEHSKNSLSEPSEPPNPEKNGDLEKLWFDSLNLVEYENKITDTPVLLFEDARQVFLFTQKHLNSAKEYYSLENRASDHVQIVQDHSQLLRHLMAFEEDEIRQCKMLKKRIEILEVVLKELNPKYYLNVCRQLWFELGETYYDLMQLKFEKVKDAKDVPPPQVFKKINGLAESSTLNFNNFLDSVKDKKKEQLPETLPEDLVGPILIAHFYLGRLCYKYITQDKRKQIENTTRSYEAFKYIVEYCERNEKGREAIGEELNISKEMMSLLQIKITQF
ncbi:hypothetical protein RUM43_009680 [Polyplax serrata]|uniref:KIF-binding protein n=1 Tax=Polyplax serrata TaxID=468196 RepID=A0AAN8S7M1_POLSC